MNQPRSRVTEIAEYSSLAAPIISKMQPRLMSYTSSQGKPRERTEGRGRRGKREREVKRESDKGRQRMSADQVSFDLDGRFHTSCQLGCQKGRPELGGWVGSVPRAEDSAYATSYFNCPGES